MDKLTNIDKCFKVRESSGASEFCRGNEWIVWKPRWRC